MEEDVDEALAEMIASLESLDFDSMDFDNMDFDNMDFGMDP